MTVPDVPQRCGYDHYLGQCERCRYPSTTRNPEQPEPKAPTVEEMRATVEQIRAMDPCAKWHVMGWDGHCARCGRSAISITASAEMPKPPAGNDPGAAA